MATKREEIIHVLEITNEGDIEIIHFSDEMVVRIKTKPKEAPAENKKGKWARVAEKLSQENLLRDGLGDELRKHARRFRETFVLK